MNYSRRDSLRYGGGALTAAWAGVVGCSEPTEESSPAGLPKFRTGRVKLGISTYSYWHFKGPKYPCEGSSNMPRNLVSKPSRSCTARWKTKPPLT